MELSAYFLPPPLPSIVRSVKQSALIQANQAGWVAANRLIGPVEQKTQNQEIPALIIFPHSALFSDLDTFIKHYMSTGLIYSGYQVVL